MTTVPAATIGRRLQREEGIRVAAGTDLPPAERTPDSWRRALAPGEHHRFSTNAGWWDARDLAPEVEDVSRLRAALVRALPPLPPGSAVLDVGAGTGTLVLLLAGFHPRLRYTLLDANPAALDRAAQKLGAAFPRLKVEFRCERVDPLAGGPLGHGAYRLVTSSIALHDIARPAAPDDAAGQARHWTEHVGLLRRIWTSLEPGGHLVYADAMRPRFRVVEHLAALAAAGFEEVDCAYAVGRLLVCGGQRSSGADAAAGAGSDAPQAPGAGGEAGGVPAASLSLA